MRQSLHALSWLMYRTCLQTLLLPVCVAEAGHLAAVLLACTHGHGCSQSGRPIMALSALLCLRRRIRSMAVNGQMLKMVWQLGGNAYGRLSHLACMLKSLDRKVYTSEELLIRRFQALIDETVICAYQGISWTRRRWARVGCHPSAPLQHLRCILKSLHNWCAPYRAA